MSELAPGWYPDPDDETQRRYWDGIAWSAPLSAAGDGSARPGRARTLLRKPSILFGVGGVLLLLAASTWWFGFRSFEAGIGVGLVGLDAAEADAYSESLVAYEVDDAGTCSGIGGFSDIAAGRTVTVSGPSGDTVATARLGAGKPDSDGLSCSFVVRVRVPAGLDTYGVAVGERGTVQFSEKELRKGALLTLSAAE